ncbi:MAG: hypothetical protein PHZ26_02605 [Candidatus Gracilibacteria bacterium]|nr:hypothetical protein [Candidatus Gracilibacteria bacterium]MDD2908623.1 hypothetical protein [Candidatus Gracilibacteria bacterium]
MFIKAIPLDISFSEEALTYYIKEDQKKYINIGSVVSIPIKNKISHGIVSGIFKTSDIGTQEIKSIVEVLCSFSLLNKYQIEIIFDLSAKYFLPIHKVLNLFLPKFILNRLEKNSFQDILNINNETYLQKTKNKPVFLHNISIKSIEEVLKENIGNLEDTVIIFPDDFSIDSFLAKNKDFEQGATIYKNSYTYSKKYKTFLDILSKKNNILFGTRKVLQYNLGAYKKLVYIEDSMVKYNYNQFEKYSNLDVLKSMINQNFFEVYFISSVPSIEFFYSSKVNNYTYKTV